MHLGLYSLITNNRNSWTNMVILNNTVYVDFICNLFDLSQNLQENEVYRSALAYNAGSAAHIPSCSVSQRAEMRHDVCDSFFFTGDSHTQLNTFSHFLDV